MRYDLPSGTVTFLFTDVEGSTRLLSELGTEVYADALAEHRRLVREACAAHDGVEVDTQGDAFFFAFATAPGALAAAADLTDGLAATGRIRVRVGLHTGTPLLGEEGYVGHDVHRAARIAAAGHGGQVLVSASTAPLVETELTDLGEHRLKDLGAPERVFQLGDGEFAPLKSLYQTNLPVPATPFLGREQDLTGVVALLSREDARLVTLTGPGGTGKTRLVLQAAAEASDGFADGVFWIPLAPLRDASLLETTFAQALEVSEQPGVAIADSIVKVLAGKRALVVVDNCEHLVDAVAALLRKLLETCPRLVVAASSRERLGLRAERVYAVPPMLPSDGELLFCERALAIASDFECDEHVAAICDAVDGLPLAIELAAARVRSLSTQAIRERLGERLGLLTSRDRDRDERHRTLEATITWSYELLDSEERRVLRALSVFADGCTLEAAEAVAGADLDLLESLLDKSLIRHRIDPVAHDRYWMLETIREYATQRLEGAREGESTRLRHAEYYLRLAEEAESQLRGSEASQWLARIEVDHANMRASLTSSMRIVSSDWLDLRLAGALARFWWIRSYLEEGHEWLRVTLGRPGEQPPDVRARALRGLGYLLWARGEREEIAPALEEALELYRVVGDTLGASICLANLGIYWREEGDLPRARRLLEESATIQRESGEQALLAHALAQLGAVAVEDGDLDSASELCEEGLALARAVGNEQTASLILEDLSYIALRAGRLSEAHARLAECLELARTSENMSLVASCLKGAAAVAAVRGDVERAVRIIGAADALDEEIHGFPDAPQHPDDERVLAVARAHLPDEPEHKAWSGGRAMSVDEAIDYAFSD